MENGMYLVTMDGFDEPIPVRIYRDTNGNLIVELPSDIFTDEEGQTLEELDTNDPDAYFVQAQYVYFAFVTAWTIERPGEPVPTIYEFLAIVRRQEANIIDSYGLDAARLVDEAVVRNYFDREAGACRGLEEQPTQAQLQACASDIGYNDMTEFLGTIQSIYDAAYLLPGGETVRINIEGSSTQSPESVLGGANINTFDLELDYRTDVLRIAEGMTENTQWWSGSNRGQGGSGTRVPSDWGNYTITNEAKVREINQAINQNNMTSAEQIARRYVDNPPVEILYLRITKSCDNCIEIFVVLNKPSRNDLRNAILGVCGCS